jgi:L-ascorbate metabolism protein UlaG (beta-lactamase superfamily)
MEIIFHGHACFEVIGKEGRILIDPFLTGNPAADVGVEDFQELDGILVSHGHSDHIGDAIELSRRTGAPIICVHELARLCSRYNVPTHAMHIGGKYKFNFGTVRLTQALHGSMFEPQEEKDSYLYGGLACGFLVEMEGKWLYHAGDTGLFGDMELLGRLYPLEVAILPIGDNYTMGVHEAVYAATLLKPKHLVPMHYNTFPIIQQDPKEFVELVQQKLPTTKGKILNPGQSLMI